MRANALYIQTVLFYVYLMRSNGVPRDGNDPMLHEPVCGWLEYVKSPPDSLGPRMQAHLRDGRGGAHLLKPLQWARLRRIDGGVLHLTGREECGRPNTKAKSELRRQSWLCAADPAEAAPLLARVPIGEWAREIEDIPLDSPLWGPA